jgi:ubiquinone/menaquinone biosynthesis C-methylase UbiE
MVSLEKVFIMHTFLDYDKLAEEYSQHRKVHPRVLQRLFDAAQENEHQRILEVGCGTGNYIRTLQGALHCTAFGIDPSTGMLMAAASMSQDVCYAQARAERLPIAPGTIDFVFNVDVIHHVRGLAESYDEIRRILKPGGMVCTVTESPQLIRTRVPLSSYFPETVPYELKRYPTVKKLKQVMAESGLETTRQDIVRFPYLINDTGPFESKAFSTLHLIPDEAFQRGLDRMRIDLENGPIPACSHYLMLWGRRKI